MFDRVKKRIRIMRIIAGKEIKELSRDNLFRVWAISVFAVVAGLNIFATMPIHNIKKSMWVVAVFLRPARGAELVPSTFPAAFTVVSTILLSLAVHIASFKTVRKDYALDSNRVFQAREYPNLAWLAGKAAGILTAFMFVTAVTLIPALLYNIFDPDATVDLAGYLFYPIAVSIPAYCFIIGVSFLLAMFVGNQVLATTFLVLLGALVTEFVAKPYCWLLDPFAVRLPILKSEIAGFPDMAGIILSRSIPLIIGVSALAAASLLYKRLIQSRAWKIFALSVALSGALAAAGLLIRGSAVISNSREMRETLIAMDEQAAKLPTPVMKKCDIALFHAGDEIRCEARIVVSNENDVPLESYLFTLNPGLAVEKVERGDRNVPFERKRHHLIVRPEERLEPGGLDSFTVYYRGAIDEEACCLYMSEKDRMKAAFNLESKFVAIEKRMAAVSDGIIVLPKDVHWYPVCGNRYDPSNPFFQRTEYTRYSLKVGAADGLTPVSQGRMTTLENGDRLFAPRYPLDGISLFAGKYSKRAVDVDSTTYEIYSFADYDLVEKYFLAISDTVAALIKDIRDEKESEYGLSYPFDKFAIVEVPAFYYASGNRWWVGGDRIEQPEIRLVTERGFEDTGEYSRRFREFGTWHVPEINTRKQFCSCLFQGRIGYTILHAPFFAYSNAISAPGREYFGKAVDSYIESRRYWEPVEDLLPWLSQFHGWEYMNLWLHGGRLPVCEGTGLAEALPAELYVARGVCLLKYLEAFFGGDKFGPALNKYIEENRFRNISLDEFVEAMNARLGGDILPIIDRWLSTDELPGFVIGDAVCSGDGAGVFSKVSFKARNGEPVPGVFSARLGFGGDNEAFHVCLEAGESRTIEIPCLKCPSRLSISTYLSRNLPCRFNVQVHDGGNSGGGIMFSRGDLAAGENGSDPSVVIVDDDDPGFVITEPKPSRLRKVFSPGNREEGGYSGFAKGSPPAKWTRIHDNMFFGDYVKTARFCKAGKGERKVTWNAGLEKDGYYEIFVYISDRPFEGMNDRFVRMYYDRHHNYTIAHSEGVDMVKFNLLKAEAGWNLLGRYYMYAGKASVELTNESESFSVIADAVMWKRDD